MDKQYTMLFFVMFCLLLYLTIDDIRNPCQKETVESYKPIVQFHDMDTTKEEDR